MVRRLLLIPAALQERLHRRPGSLHRGVPHRLREGSPWRCASPLSPPTTTAPACLRPVREPRLRIKCISIGNLDWTVMQAAAPTTTRVEAATPSLTRSATSCPRSRCGLILFTAPPHTLSRSILRQHALFHFPNFFHISMFLL